MVGERGLRNLQLLQQLNGTHLFLTEHGGNVHAVGVGQRTKGLDGSWFLHLKCQCFVHCVFLLFLSS